MTRSIYNYDAQTKEFVSASTADESPLEKGVYLLPSNATYDTPPVVIGKQVAVFESSSWVVKDDYRGTTYWLNGVEYTIVDIGIAPPNGSTAEKPPLTQAEKKNSKWAEIKNERDRRIQSGGYKVGELWFHSDTFSRTQQMGLVMMGAGIPANTLWKTMDGTFITMTQALAGQIFTAAGASDIAIFSAAETHKAAMEAAADPAAYDFSGGWPKVFGE